jgi:hypothetical protein
MLKASWGRKKVIGSSTEIDASPAKKIASSEV